MLGKTIYTHVLDTEYAARVHDPHTYDVVSRDVISRWAFPLVPDANLLPGTAYRLSGHGVYREAGVTLARSSTLVRDCVVGRVSPVLGRAAAKPVGSMIHPSSYSSGSSSEPSGIVSRIPKAR